MKRKIIYSIQTGLIDSIVDETQRLESYIYNYKPDIKADLSEVIFKAGDIPYNWGNCRVVNNKLVLITEDELNELIKYNRVLTEKEREENRIRDSLIPSIEEVQKARNTIEILTLLQEVL